MNMRRVQGAYSAGIRYVVIETRLDGTVWTWGPFSAARADAAVDALLTQHSVESARSLPLLPSSALDVELPDWKRGVRA